MHSNHTLYSVVWLILFLALPVSAQEKKEPGERNVAVPEEGAAPLPKIDLPEFLITGQEAIDLPPTSKPIEEEDRIYSPGALSPGRKDIKVDVGQKPETSVATPEGQMNGRVLAGMGMYTSPTLEGWFGKDYDQGGVLFHAGYESSAGYISNTNRQKTDLGFSGDYRPPATSGLLSGSRLEGGLSFSGKSYRAFGSTDPSQARSLNDLRIHAGISSSVPSSFFEAPAVYSAGVNWNGSSLDDSTNASQNDFGFSAQASSQKWGIPLRGWLDFQTSAVSMNLPAGTATHAPQWFTIGLSGERSLTQLLQASVGVAQYLYSGNVRPSSGRFFPTVDLRYFASGDATVFLKYDPTVRRNTLFSLAAANNYILNREELRQSEVPVALTVGSDFNLDENSQGRGSLSYRSIGNYPYFMEIGSAKVWDVMYLPTVHVTEADLEGSYRLSPGGTAVLLASWNSTTEADSANSVPNIPSFRISGIYRRSIDSALSVEGYARYVSKRWTNFAHSSANAGFIDVGLRGDYRLLDNLQAELNVENLFDQHYYLWGGYLEQPAYVSLAFTYRW
ncbi:MAG TPA: hypothetical protein VMG34_08740 [Bacteroidota bacterium]|nr:hypothetical protein [Bacteroidota bacterium]